MRNRHPGTCYRCGGRVEAGAGHFERVRGRPGDPKWRVQHAVCAIVYRGTDKRAGDGRRPSDFSEHVEDMKERVKDAKALIRREHNPVGG